MTVQDADGRQDVWMTGYQQDLLAGARDQCGHGSNGQSPVVVLDLAGPAARPPIARGPRGTCPDRAGLGDLRSLAGPVGRGLAESLVEWLPWWAAVLAAVVPWPPGPAVSVVAPLGALVAVWWTRGARGRADPMGRVWWAAGSVALLAALAGQLTGRWPAPWVGEWPAARVAGLVLLLGSLHLLAMGPWLVWQPPESWVLEPRLTGHQSGPLGPMDSPAPWLAEAEAALRRLTVLSGAASLVGAHLVLPGRGPVARPASTALVAIAVLIWMSWAGRVRGHDLARAQSVVAVGLVAMAAVATGAPARPWALLAAGLGLGLLALGGGRLWDLVWWPAAHPRLNRWLLAVTFPAGVAASGVVEFLSRIR